MSLNQPLIASPNDDRMQTNETQFKPLMEQKKQWGCGNYFCLYYGE